MNIKLHPERCASIGREAELSGTHTRCIIMFLYSWGIVRSSLNPMRMAIIPPGYLGIYVSYQSLVRTAHIVPI